MAYRRSIPTTRPR